MIRLYRMKKLLDIMDDLGFKENGSDEVKKAFVKNLIQAAQKPRNEKIESQLSLFDQKENATPYPSPIFYKSKKVS